ncbi:MAG: hypothetical protein LC730_02920 [Acidobacteria bacterium]|nr:hypothetical protein [Acidobacteriota bacterium]MCA1608397.1 hypothetical protein [Acidobacteriota bacterium]
MNRTKIFVGMFAFALFVLGLPSVASAQWRDRDDDDRYGNGRNGNYNNLRGVVERLQNRARNFERRIDRIDDRHDDRYGNDRYGNGRWGRNNRNDRYDNLDSLASSFKNATENLRNEFGRGRNLNNSRDEAQRVLDIGYQIDQQISNNRGNRNRGGQQQWSQIRSDLQILENAYGLNRYNRGRDNGNWRNRIPFPLPF